MAAEVAVDRRGSRTNTSVPAVVVAFVLSIFAVWNGAAQPLVREYGAPDRFRPDRILVKPRQGADLTALAQTHQRTKAWLRRSYPALGGWQVVRLPPGLSVEKALEIYRASGLVEYAEPDYVVRAAREPNEPGYFNGPLWNLFNWGQLGGTTDSDIDAAEGWDLAYDASGIVVCVLDSGIRVTHEDLAANLWVNPGEIPGNGVDDDSNGYVDDVHGINAINNTGNLTDEPNHGTHVAGTLGAVGNNGIGIVGVAWRVKLMGAKFLNAQFEGTVSDAVECIEYARLNGARIINASWGGRTGSHFFSQALYDAINNLRQHGIIFVAAAGNEALNNDLAEAFYPASFDLDNIISVAATTRDDALAHFSCWGPNSVDLGAPGYIVYSCWATADNAYDYDNGTSMAAPHVAAACALAWTLFPGENYQQIIQRVLAGVDAVPDLAGKCKTGGRLNLRKVLQSGTPVIAPRLIPLGFNGAQFHFRVSGTPHSTVTILAGIDLNEWTTVHTGQLGEDGTLIFSDASAPPHFRYYRAIAAP